MHTAVLATREQSIEARVEEDKTEHPAIILCRTSQYAHLKLADQFEKVLMRSPIDDLELHQQQSIVSQIVQWWEGSEPHTLEARLMAGDVSIELRNAAIPILHNISAQILHMFALYNIWDIRRAVAKPQSEEGQIFETYQKLFRIVKNLCPTNKGFIVQSSMITALPESSKAVRTANLASFISACFGLRQHGFYHLNRNFFEIFSGSEGISAEWQVEMCLQLKIQAYLSAISRGERAKDLVLEEIFPEDVTIYMPSARPDGVGGFKLADGFISRAKALRQEFESAGTDETSIKALKSRYAYRIFLQQLTDYAHDYFEEATGLPFTVVTPMCDNVEGMRIAANRTTESRILSSTTDENTLGAQNINGIENILVDTREDSVGFQASIPRYAYSTSTEVSPSLKPEKVVLNGAVDPISLSSVDIIAQAAKAVQAAIFGFSQVNSEDGLGPFVHNPHGPRSSDNSVHQQSPIMNAYQSGRDSPQVNAPSTTSSRRSNEPTGNDSSSWKTPSTDSVIKQPPLEKDSPYLQKHQHTSIPPETSYYQLTSSTAYGPPGQSQPTAILYERARQVANSKSSNVSRNKTSNVSQRRPWTLEEEQALMDGLDQVKGPHWSQILVLYGPGGSINETLRDRTQVQLKDKARNLKLFFLKSKIEVPYYLSFVTGELKSRAPSHISAFDNTPPRSIGQSNGIFMSSTLSSTSRNRIIPAQMSQAALINSILSLPQSNGTYSSPYAAVPGSETILHEADNIDNSNHDDTDHQNVIDLANSAAAQVAAALANFNALDLPGYGISPSVDIDTLSSLEASSNGLSYQHLSSDETYHETERQSLPQSHQNGTSPAMPDVIEIDARS